MEDLQNPKEISPDLSDDIQKLKFLSSLIILNKNLNLLKQRKEINKSQDLSSPENKVDRSGSFMISQAIHMKSSRTFSFFTKKKVCKVYLDKEEEVNIIRYVYKKIFLAYNIQDSDPKPKLELSYFIQFLLDSYIITQHFLSLFLLPLNKERFIDEDKFLLSLESIQQMSFERASFFYQERDSQFKKNVAIQKMLCKKYLVFFKLVEFCNGTDLKEDELCCVLSMSLRNSKKSTDAKTLSKNTFDKMEKLNKGVRKPAITFKDFYKILISGNT